MKESIKSKEEQIPPFQLNIKDEIGSFHIVENNSGSVRIEIINKEGKKIVLSDLLPEGYEAIGNRRIMSDAKFLGLGNVDTSIADIENKVLVVSESEVKNEGRRYFLTFLHELGHIKRHEANPLFKKERDSEYTQWTRHPKDVEAFKRAEALIAQDERDAWAFAIREYRKIIGELGIPKERIFKSANELMEFVRQTSLGLKANEIRKHVVGQFSISEEGKKRLAAEIFRMYSREELP